MPNSARTPATPKAPMPTPAVFALAVISTWASFSSVRTSRLDSSVTWLISAAIESSGGVVAGVARRRSGGRDVPALGVAGHGESCR